MRGLIRRIREREPRVLLAWEDWKSARKAGRSEEAAELLDVYVRQLKHLVRVQDTLRVEWERGLR